jgi:hypothetical protein
MKTTIKCGTAHKSIRFLELVQKFCKKLGLGNYISMVENIPNYKMMSDSKRPFLQCSVCCPHSEDENLNMQMMVFANPTLLGLLLGQVDIYVDATFNPCTPDPFLQCLIVMVFDNQTGWYVPVVYTLTTHKYALLYYQVFTQLKTITKNKMKVRTFTSNFERAEMNMPEVIIGKRNTLGACFTGSKPYLSTLKRNVTWGIQQAWELQ